MEVLKMSHKEEEGEESKLMELEMPSDEGLSEHGKYSKHWKDKDALLKQYLTHEEKTYNGMWKKLPQPV